ncbi:YbaB/EbfC family nucleoid-associated protein [Salininema proteolyticum]|uniref:YbaB/EbfC family nucleoid-associated protein n=1 Tax=Salininema proteolyticum TaxID=1607685 RepID=A0ABV8TYM3_9ACTN
MTLFDGSDQRATIEKLEALQAQARERLSSLESAHSQTLGLKTVLTDDQGAVTVTVSGRGDVEDVAITPTGIRLREALGPIVTETIAEAKQQHNERLRSLQPPSLQ